MGVEEIGVWFRCFQALLAHIYRLCAKYSSPKTNILESRHLGFPKHLFYVCELLLPGSGKKQIEDELKAKLYIKTAPQWERADLTSAPWGLSSSPQLVRLQKLRTPPGFNKRITWALDRGQHCFQRAYLVRKLRPNEVEMMSVPFSIGERVSVVEDSIKVAGGETGTHLSKWYHRCSWGDLLRSVRFIRVWHFKFDFLQAWLPSTFD